MRKENRLAREAAFREVLDKGRRRESPELKISILEGCCGPPFLGIVVGRKLGAATKRNRFKRRVREAVRKHPGFAEGVRVVVVAKPGALRLTYAEINALIEAAFGRTGEEVGKSGENG
ncbi:MAG: ribonuclease P protein component [Candidatus Coatesbacteria bacterium]|nr:MAG: ribonuclease P protein component [Candidatus Coatesbacteria bacterium]